MMEAQWSLTSATLQQQRAVTVNTVTRTNKSIKTKFRRIYVLVRPFNTSRQLPGLCDEIFEPTRSELLIDQRMQLENNVPMVNLYRLIVQKYPI
ncbi:hypothetical protein RvY_06649 [Ramazzottius varieornatus]|uniref:Uncharacterized protein n=1 Tax=Ramazzottius varieornatus TaxID=947166 RepID=A0A1D1V800_RAMVA|nr:hypothetical protein RvY_06649 [Ramazzottius varieornatus]